MKKLFSFLLIGILQGGSFANGSENFYIHLQSPQSNFILGEPIPCLVTVVNPSSAPLTFAFSLSPPSRTVAFNLVGPVRAECKAERKYVEEGLMGDPPVLGAEQTFTVGVLDLRDLGVVDEGNYEFWIDYDSEKLEALKTKPSQVKTQSNHLRITLTAPAEIDAAVFANYSNRCNQITLTPNDLLSRFPTSTYAGYELAKGAKENLQDYINMSYEDRDEVLGVRGLLPEKQDAYRKERMAYFEEKLRLLQEFIAHRPDFVQADRIRSGISFYLLILGRQKEAIEEMKILSRMDGRWAEGAKKALNLVCRKDDQADRPSTK